MGLDVTAYEVVKRSRKQHPKDEGECYTDTHRRMWPEASGQDGQADKMRDGCFDTSGSERSFRAGSYGGYNDWRAQLAALVGTTPEAVWGGGPALAFRELINFSDCEGVIGPKTSAKLAADFDAWRDRAAEFASHIEDAEWFMDRYDEWRAAFHLAAGTGCVVLH